MKYIVLLLCLLILLVLSACNLEKRVYITTGGYETSGQVCVPGRNFKPLKMPVDSYPRDTTTLWKYRR